MWSRENRLPPDFFDYPAYIVDEVLCLQAAEADILDDIERSQKLEEDWRRKANGG